MKNVTCELLPRCVTGIPAYAGPAIAEVMPGTISNGTLRLRERLRFFAAATEDERIAALQPHDALSFPGFLHEQRVDFLLRQRVRARFLPGENRLRTFRRPPQHFGIAEVIVNDHLRLLDALLRAQRDEPEIARTRRRPENISLLFLIRH